MVNFRKARSQMHTGQLSAGTSTVVVLCSVATLLFFSLVRNVQSQALRAPVGVPVVANTPPASSKSFTVYCKNGIDSCITSAMGYDFPDGPLQPPFFINWSPFPPSLMFLADTIMHVNVTARIDWRTTTPGTRCTNCEAFYYTDVALDCASYYDDSVHVFGSTSYSLCVFSMNGNQTAYNDTAIAAGFAVYNNTIDTISIASYELRMDSSIDVLMTMSVDSETKSSLLISPRTYAKPVLKFASAAQPYSHQRDFNGALTVRITGPGMDSTFVRPVLIRFLPTDADVSFLVSPESPRLICENVSTTKRLLFLASSPTDEFAKIELFDVLGHKVRDLFEGPVGPKETRFEASMGPGMYFARMQTGSTVATTKVLVSD